jgi:hypothetical protein
MKTKTSGRSFRIWRGLQLYTSSVTRNARLLAGWRTKLVGLEVPWEGETYLMNKQGRRPIT